MPGCSQGRPQPPSSDAWEHLSGLGERGERASERTEQGLLLFPALALAVGSWVCGIRFQA